MAPTLALVREGAAANAASRGPACEGCVATTADHILSRHRFKFGPCRPLRPRAPRSCPWPSPRSACTTGCVRSRAKPRDGNRSRGRRSSTTRRCAQPASGLPRGHDTAKRTAGRRRDILVDAAGFMPLAHVRKRLTRAIALARRRSAAAHGSGLGGWRPHRHVRALAGASECPSTATATSGAADRRRSHTQTTFIYILIYRSDALDAKL